MEYSNDGVNWQSSQEFPFVASGGYNITVRRKNTDCVSSAANCNAEAAFITKKSALSDNQLSYKIADGLNKPEERQTKIAAYPNPFNDKVRFMVTSAVGGKRLLFQFTPVTIFR